MGPENCTITLPSDELPGPRARPISMEALTMRETRITLGELALIAGTRGMLGAGLALLLADRLPEGQRKAVGWTLLLVGVLTTVPLALDVLGASRPVDWEDWMEPSQDVSRAYSG
jgi:hypothetical protein